ncbi:hypothetical protein [Chondromyces crocatus]|uniref:Lipoprotein n=1 Tax=Chondromyces crocatus TaxID=52 RepID=A0A0K1ESS4_CHOCO|nr:hypothetical protein [Chondromyces crocatus]AKT43985.1 uncharacterized protein CMC5_082230 [Chondromyces crocatus]
MARSCLLPLLAAASLCAAAGCVDTDPTVFVDASIVAPELALERVALGVSLQGTFALDLHLGPRASGTSEVSLNSFSITNADQSTTLVASLPASPANPVEVDPGEDVRVELRFATDPGTLSAEDALCTPNGIRITGTIQDSLQDGQTPVASPTFSARCTP